MNAEVARVSGCAKLLQKWNTMHPSVVWFREDLRVADNPALSAAAGLGNPIVALFVLDEESEGIRPLGAASRWWLHHSLETLAASLNRLGIELVIRRGAAASIVTEVARSVAASHVLWNRRYGAAERALDSALKQALTESGVVAQSFQAGLLNEPWTVETLAGKPFSVFTPYYRACLQRPNPRRDIPVPENAEGYRGLSSERLADWKLLPQEPDWAQGLRERWQPGEQGGQARLQKFLEHNLVRYAEGRDIPGETNTSELSAHLRWGEVSPFQVWHRTQQVASADPRLEKSAASFLRELGWREFSYNLLYHWPDLATKNFNAKFDVFPWRNTQGTSPEDMESARALQAWKRGETGIPLVDAGMRELWQTGFMHNRVRMVAASFLTKNLLIDWRVGEQWFWDTLVDADPANNAASWQWVAGSGADAAPYFRVFNPELQASKFDPKGVYVQRWVPEIANGEPLKQPIVDLKESRNRALAAYQVMSDQVAASS